MRARATTSVYAILAILLCSSAAGAGFDLTPSFAMPSLDGASSFGFPAALVDSGLNGGSISSLDAMSSLNSSKIFSSLGQSMPGMSSSAFGQSLPGMSGTSFGQMPSSFSVSDLLAGQDYQPADNSVDDSTASTAGTYDYSNNGDTITVKLGDTIHLELPARIDQGYIWNLTLTGGLNTTDERVVTPQSISSFFSGMSLSNLQVTMEWDIQAVKTGTQVILGSYKSSTDNGPYDDSYKLTIIVE